MASSSKAVLAIIFSMIVAVVALIFASVELLPSWANPFIISAFAYVISLAVSSIYQYTSCNKVNIQAISLSNLLILGSTLMTSAVLYLGSIPFLDKIYGEYDPRNPYDGLPYEHGSKAWLAGMENKNHYKLQFFSSIVKAVIPIYVEENLKQGFVFFYWIFWMTILPLFFILGFQGICLESTT
jgi:hypothetical protein